MAAEKIAKIQSFQGLISAPFTAFKSNGELKADIIPQYVDHLVRSGVKGVFVNGTTGEGLSLSVAERKAIAEGWVNAGRGKLDIIIIQVGANSVKDAVELAAHAEKIQPTGIASLPPLFYKPQTHEHLIAYLKNISDAAPTLPLMLYHIPSYSSVEIKLAEFMPKARQTIPNFCGAKFTSTEVRDLLKCHSLSGPPFKLLSGFDEVLLPCMASGVTAAVGASYNFMAPYSLKIVEAYKRGDLETARNLQGQVLLAVERLCSHGQGISCFKAAMNFLGPLDVGPPRIPLVPLGFDELLLLKEDLKDLQAKGVV